MSDSRPIPRRPSPTRLPGPARPPSARISTGAGEGASPTSDDLDPSLLDCLEATEVELDVAHRQIKLMARQRDERKREAEDLLLFLEHRERVLSKIRTELAHLRDDPDFRETWRLLTSPGAGYSDEAA